MNNNAISYDRKIKIAQANAANPFTDITPYELEIGMSIVRYSGFFCQTNEVMVYVTPAKTFKDKEKVTGYTGSSAGVSVRVAKGVAVRSGGSGSKAIRNVIRDYNYGDLIITNKRVVFIGKNDSFDFSIDKLTAFKILDKSCFTIQSGRTSKNVEVDQANLLYSVGFIKFVQQQKHDNKDLYSYITNNRLTDPQLAYCNQVAQEYAGMSEVKNNSLKRTTNIGCIIVIIIAVILFIPIIAILLDCSWARDTMYNDIYVSSSNVITVASVTVSDCLDPAGERTYYGENTIDGNMDTSWIVNTGNEGAAGAWIQYNFESVCAVYGMRMVNGNVYKEDYYFRNGHVKEFRLDFSDGTAMTFTAQEIESRSLDSNVFYFESPINTEYVKLTVISSYLGSKEEYLYNTAITEVEFIPNTQFVKSSTEPETTTDTVTNITTTEQITATTTVLPYDQTPRIIILNTNTHVYHLNARCRAVSHMKEKNKRIVEATVEEVKAKGYTPCDLCA